MAKVPYSPAPSVEQSQIAQPNISVDAPSEAFGGGIAKGIGDLGAQVSRSADELFSRAAAMQELANQSEARDADTQYTIEAGKLHAAYSTLSEQDAVAAYPKYAQDLQGLRNSVKTKLTNPDAMRRFDASSQGSMAQLIFSGAGHAAEQNKKWSLGTIQSQIDLDASSVHDNPFDDASFEQKLTRTKANAAQLSDHSGFDIGGAEEQELTKKAVSRLWSERITGASRQEPFKAVQMLEANRAEMTDADYKQADVSVRSETRASGSANIAEQSYDPSGSKTFEQMEETARAKAKALDPDDPVLEKNSVTALKGLYRDKQYIEAQETNNNRATVREGILDGVKTEQELRADPKIASAIDNLPASDRLAIPGQINRYNDARDKTTQQDNYLQLWGKSNNDVEGFLNTDVTKYNLSQPDMRKLMAQQQKIKDEQGGDPRVGHAINILRGSMGSQLEALGVYARTSNNMDEYDKFTGAVQSALDVWNQEHGKPPTAQDIIQEIGPRVVQQRAEPSWTHLWSNQRGFFDQDIPDAVATKIKADVVAKGGVEPTDEQVYKAYVRAQYLKLYGSKKDQSRAPNG